MDRMTYKKESKNIITLVVTLLFTIAGLLSCATPHPAPAVLTREGQPSVHLVDLQMQIHDLINKERRKHGLSALAWNDTLSEIARRHSQDMARRNFFSHVSPEGHDLAYRYKQEGYSCSVTVRERIYGGAENIFQNNLYDRVMIVNGVSHYDWNTAGTIAASTVRGWMNSPGHRKNILTPHWRSEGIGIAISPDDKVYITENFC